MREWLKDARAKSGMTMKQAADKLHISESYYCSIENGYRQKNMDISLAERISQNMGISLKQILLAEAQLRDQNAAQETG